MSTDLAFSDIDDAVLLTQANLIKRGAFVDMQTDLQDHVLVRELWKGRKKKFSGGDPWTFDCQVDHNHSAHAVGMYETDGSSVADTFVEGSVSVRHVNAHYIYDQREPSFQKGGAAIVDLVQSKYTGMMVSLFEYLEGVLWGKPASSADKKTPYGIEYWVVKNATSGFYGADPAGFTDGRANITTASQPRWANYSGTYGVVSGEDLIRKMRKMHRQTKFRSVISHSEPDLGGMKNGIYMNDTTIGLCEELLEQQNTDLGSDLDSQGGRAMFKSSPLVYAPYLDASTDNPVYMLDWKWLALGVLDGWENQLTAPYMVPDKHLVRRVDLDASMQMVCTNLRRQGVLYQA
jgi:hypothetical protein